MLEKILIIVVIGWMLAACSASPQAAQPRVGKIFFELKGGSKKGAATIKHLIGVKEIRLDELLIKNWPISEFPCQSCDYQLEQRFHPHGPSQWLMLKNHNKLMKTWAVSTYLSQVQVGIWRVEFNTAEVTFTHTGKKLILTFPYASINKSELEKNICKVLWFKREAQVQPSQYIANDVADFKTQIIWQCQP